MKLFGIGAVLAAMVTLGAQADTITRTEYAGGPVMTYTDGVLTHVNGVRVPPPPPAPTQVTQVVVVHQQCAPPPRVVYVEQPRVVVRHYHQPTYCAPVRVRSCESRVNVGLSVGIRFGGHSHGYRPSHRHHCH